ncbi:hypothetical protein [Yersinia thracica]|uniref:hypothetical protein n=1 Tax=Yersinia thracica TaxID=2890319 RepID=UPI001F3C6E3F|nr:hypothetical protein [Yersinia thracica]
MIKLYVEYVLDRYTPRENMRSSAYQSTHLAANLSVSITTKKAIAYSIAKTVAESFSVSNIVRAEINKKGLFLINAGDLYGKVQKSAMAARKLQVIDPKYYNLLRINNIEMFYIYIEPLFLKQWRKYVRTLI